jgi:hypothetical protein
MIARAISRPIVFTVLGKSEAPPDIYRIKYHKGDIALMQFLGHHRAGVALAGTALCQNSKRFGRSGDRKLNGTKIDRHGGNI